MTRFRLEQQTVTTRAKRSFLIEYLLVLAIIAVLVIAAAPYLTGRYL